MKGKLIVIEGTDCSGKQTQSEKLVEYLTQNNRKVIRYSFPMYDTPSGKIIGGPCLGKEYICDGWFDEGFTNVDGKVAALYYAADRLYNINKITNKLNEGYDVILDRYVHSNMAHQGGKIYDKDERIKMYNFIEKLEFDLCNLPKPDGIIFLHMPLSVAKKIRLNRLEALDEAEKDEKHLINAENTYLELCNIYNYIKIECAENNEARSIDLIFEDVLNAYNKIKG